LNWGTKDDPIVFEDIINKYKQEVILSEGEGVYAGRTKFYVLPNTGQVRKALGITKLDIKLEGNRNSFNAYFEDTCQETYKIILAPNEYNVKVKEGFMDEWWYYDWNIEADSRNHAIYKAYKQSHYDFTYNYSFIEFKKLVSCKKTREVVFDKWKKIR
jgi:hypothetical protein